MAKENKTGQGIALTLTKKVTELISTFFSSRSALTEAINMMEKEKKNIEKQYEEVNRLNVELNLKMKQLIATQDMARAILSELNLEQLMNIVMEILKDTCRINRAIIMLRNNKEECLEYVYGSGFSGTVPTSIKNYKVPVMHLSNILARVANTGVGEYVDDIQKSTLKKENILLKQGNPTSLYVHPLITRSTVIGVIAIDMIDNNDGVKEIRESLDVFAPQIAIAIENARLYRALQEQLIELQKSRTMLRRADKFAFLSKLSEKLAQEIREPIISIGKYIRMLPDKFNDEEFREDFLSLASKETNRVNDLISELLNLVRSTEAEFELIDLHSVIQKVILMISPHSNAKRVTIAGKFDTDIAYVWVNPEKMKQAILNILSILLEYADGNDKIEISTKKSIEWGKKDIINIIIKSDGITVPEFLLNHTSGQYLNVLPDRSGQGDIGLGLFIAHQNIQEHQGKIRINSDRGKGIEYIIDIPTEPPLQFESMQ